MTERDKKLAEQAGYKDLPTVRLAFYGFDKEKFANLIRADAMEAATRAANESWSLACKKMVEFEREACAKVCEAHKIDGQLVHSNAVVGCAAAIRARGNT